MTNSIIPYSFIPGTKAKAQEVNANFIALANQITENKEYTDSKIEETLSGVNSDRAGINLENTTLISNCVVEAPNGIITYTGNTITVKSGLKVLIPNGRNSDGTLKSIEYTVEEDELLTTSKNSTVNCVYVSEDEIGTEPVFQCSNITPVYSGGIWYNITENKNYIYDTDLASWQEFAGIVIATYENTEETVKNVKVVNPTGLLKQNDIFSIINMGMPDYANTVSKGVNTNYTATVNGYAFAFAETQQNQYKYLYIDNKSYTIGYHQQGHIGWSALCMPVAKGSVYKISSGNCRLSFIPVKGEE